MRHRWTQKAVIRLGSRSREARALTEAVAAAEGAGASQERRLRYWTPGLLVFFVAWVVVLFVFFDDPVALAQEHWPLVVLGVAGATLGNATAVGGGLVFIPAMMFVYRLDPVTALKLSLVTQAFGMSSGALAWIRSGALKLDRGTLLLTVPPSLLGAFVGAVLLAPSPGLVKGLFGPVSIAVGVTILLAARVRRQSSGVAFPRDLSSSMIAVTCLVCVIGGLLTAWVAIGIGEIVAAFLIVLCGQRTEKAVGLGVFLLAATCAGLAVLHALWLGGVLWDWIAFLVLGVVFGGRLGPYLVQWISSRSLKLFFACVAILDGLLISWQSWS